MTIGSILRRHRICQRLSQTHIADEVGVSQSTYQTWENDKALPNALAFVRLAIVLQVDLRDFIPLDLRQQLPVCPQLSAVQRIQGHEDIINLLKLTINLLQDSNAQLTADLNQLKQQILGVQSK